MSPPRGARNHAKRRRPPVRKSKSDPRPASRPSSVLASNALLPVAEPSIGARELHYVTEALRSGWVSGAGPFVARFENAFAQFVGTRHAVAVSSGTAALTLALHGLGIGAGDEVIVPDLTFVATAHAVLAVGATPVFADVTPTTWCLDPRAVEQAVTARSRALIPVHLYGQPADMQALNQCAAQHRLAVVEDAAEAHGARVGPHRVGALGQVGCFSLYGNKLITTGEGGMLTTDDDELDRRLRRLRDHGMDATRRYHHAELAFSARMSNLHAALGLAQLERVDELLAAKQALFACYREALRSRPALALNPQPPDGESVFWMVSVVLPPELGPLRDALCAKMAHAGIETRPFFTPMSELPHLRHLRAVNAAGEGCPVARHLSRCGLNLPSACTLTHPSARRVARTLLAALDALERGGFESA